MSNGHLRMLRGRLLEYVVVGQCQLWSVFQRPRTGVLT